eukprot:CAMPEP_0170274608 /NCGR_PEP_ID=MMETSP0116_2-20130129/37278_1 /TAXON_ID=400756 /ORGANISM="Durinskia baltica, Strain CSIRO CS-38" /LENGTH=146 /DNA_ID=CAMNT_0010525859 /DNA_START=15 /DNA_END=455 /DNA_ORIENTATION=+
MSSAPGNIFLTTENLAFAFPLIFVCGSYAYFKYVPLHIGLPILGGLYVLYQIRAQIQAQRDKKLTNMDEKAISDLAKELEGEDKTSETEDAKAKKLAKKKAAIQHRLAAEARKEEKKKAKKKKSDDDDDDDDVALDTFVKPSKKKN